MSGIENIADIAGDVDVAAAGKLVESLKELINDLPEPAKIAVVSAVVTATIVGASVVLGAKIAKS